ncbi:MAG: rRNA maturation RNase YbeY [Micrococcales bacterium]
MSVELENTTEVEVDLDRVLNFANFALERLYLHPQVELELTFIDEAAIEELHVEWMDEPGPTDVLSFPMDELRPGKFGEVTPAGMLGSIVICPTVAEKQALQQGHSTIHEILWLTIHGILHLLGYDHAEPAEENEMFGLQREVLDAFYKFEQEPQ